MAISVPHSEAIAPPAPATCDPTLFPFPFDADPALALNARAEKEGWSIACDTTLAFDKPELCAAREVWRARCRPGHLPAREDFTLQTLKPFLREILIVEVVNAPGAPSGRRYLHRLVGSNTAARIGELTGKFLDEALPEPIFRKTVAFFDAVVDHRCPMRILTDFDLRAVSHMRGETFAAPLAADGVTPNMMMAVFAFMKRPSSGL